MPDATAFIEQQYQKVRALQSHGDYQGALEIALPLIQFARTHLGPDHDGLAEILSTVGILSRRTGQPDKAEPLYQEALTIRRRLYGDGHPAVAAMLNNLGLLYSTTGRPDEALPLLLESVAIKERVFGSDHPEVALAMGNLGTVYLGLKRFEDAETVLTRALHIQQAEATSPRLIESLVNLATLRTATGRAVEAAEFSAQAFAASLRLLPAGHPMILECLQDLIERLIQNGDFAKALPLCEQALATVQGAFGEDHEATLRALLRLGSTHFSLGHYADAESLYQQTLARARRVLDESSPLIWSSLNALAVLRRETGDLSDAESLFDEALGIARRFFGSDAATANSISNLASLYRELERYEEAQSLFDEAIRMLEKLPESEQANLTEVYNNLALVHAEQGNYSAALPLYEASLKFGRKAYGEQHPSVATALNNLAETNREIGQYAEAERLQQDANARYERILGAHPRLERGLVNLAKIYAATGRPAEALAALLRAAAIDDQTITDIFSMSSERQRIAYVESIAGNLAGVLSLVIEWLANTPHAVQSVLDLVLRRKAIITETLARQQHEILSGHHPNIDSKLRELATLRSQITRRALTRKVSEQSQADDRQQLMRKERLEAELSRGLPHIDASERARDASRENVARRMPESSVLVEYLRFPLRDLTASSANGKPLWGPDHYAAFILLAGKPNDVRLFDLGVAEEIDAMVNAALAAITEVQVTRLGKLDLDKMLEEGIGLRTAIFDPVVGALQGRDRLLIAPDGNLARFPFEAMPLTKKKFLVDKYRISYVNTGRDILSFGEPHESRGAQSLVVADPDFDLSAAAGGTEPSVSEHFEGLPRTRQEGECIAKLLGARLLVGANAVEREVKACRSPRIVHFATHGYFLPDESRMVASRKPGVIGYGIEAPSDATTIVMAGRVGREVFSSSKILRQGRFGVVGWQGPMVRSGLVLAGVNTWLRDGPLPGEAEDGLLTAEDVAALDLTGTELVVLSACETGVGDIQVGEGVSGLRRACLTAGSRSVVMSCWNVNDEVTKGLMEGFYRRLLRGEGKADALRKSQLAVKSKYPHPFYWGPFICLGDPSPLASAPKPRRLSVGAAAQSVIAGFGAVSAFLRSTLRGTPKGGSSWPEQ